MIKRLSALILGLFLLAALQPPALAARAEEGSIRVLLSLPDSPTQLEVGVYGSYLVNDSLSFQRGSTLKVLVQGQGLMLYYEGLIHRAGPTITFRRYGSAPAQENGLRLGSSLSLYEGDLLLSVQDGAIRPILHIGIEDYLKGVVPYEMADSFPLEALKAQAVTARSYALRALRGDRDFDVYDTPADQVYRGLNPEHSRALSAVGETEGLALNYQGKLAQAFYSASNGGQTETAFNAWGREHLPYTRLTPDPYDLENPASEVRRFTLKKQWAPASAGERNLDLLLRQALTQKLNAQNAETIQVRQITALSAVGPRYDAPSLTMTRLRFDLSISTREVLTGKQETQAFSVAPAPPLDLVTPEPLPSYGPWQPQEEAVTVELGIFPAVERALDLSINARDNEIIRVEEGEDHFVLTSGRYGHGVGMSQRGAEWMAKTYAWHYGQILAFYYPGAELARYATRPAERAVLAPSFLTTPGPPPTATPRPTLITLNETPAPGQWVVVVTGIARNSTLNLRAEPSLNAAIIQQLYYGQRLLVIAEDAEGWLKVSAGETEGYVMASFTEKATD